MTALHVGGILLTALIGTGIFFFRRDWVLRAVLFLIRLIAVDLRVLGRENVPSSGAVLLAANHVSLIDLLLIQSLTARPVTFMIRKELVDFLPTRFIFWYLGVIPVPSAAHPHAMKKFFGEIQSRLRAGAILCVFPEGGISGNGCLMRFRSGTAPLVPEDTPVAVIPVRIGMLWGRLLTLYKGRIRFHLSPRFPLVFSLHAGKPVDPKITAFQLRQRISELGAEIETLPAPREVPLHTAFLFRAGCHFFHKTFQDAVGKSPNDFFQLVRCVILSRKIRELSGIEEDKYVGILLPNGSITAALILTVLYAGKVPAMMNYSAGSRVALESARKAGIRRIVTSRKFLEKIGWALDSPEFVFAEDVAPTVTKKDKLRAILEILLLPRRVLARRIAPENAFDVSKEAVLLFSSGSTGRPKGVMLTFRSLNSNVCSFWRVIGWNRADKVDGNLPLFHAYGFTVEFAFPAVSGTPAIYVQNPLDSTAVVRSIRDHRVTMLTATPTFLQNYLKRADESTFASLRLAITGAEKLRDELIRKFHALTGLEIVEGYGCTELSPIVSVNLCGNIYQLGRHADHPGSIGIALPGIHVRIVDVDTGEELGPGLPGRMQVKGGLVMKGYLNDPEATARVRCGDYYDTGDIAKMDEYGYIYITGRASRFSKIGGEMVPHEGVEFAIAQYRNREEREVAVTGLPDRRKGEKLVVFYCAEDFDPKAVVDALRGSGMPNLWIPKADDFLKIDHLPLLGSGKLDLLKLNAIAQALVLDELKS